MDYRKIITIEPGKRGGKPCIRGMRITVYDVLSYLASGMTHQEILIRHCWGPISLMTSSSRRKRTETGPTFTATPLKTRG